jgi:hypothetical protein
MRERALAGVPAHRFASIAPLKVPKPLDTCALADQARSAAQKRRSLKRPAAEIRCRSPKPERCLGASWRQDGPVPGNAVVLIPPALDLGGNGTQCFD